MYTPKLALAVVLAGGVTKYNENGNSFSSLLFFLVQNTIIKSIKEHVYGESRIFC